MKKVFLYLFLLTFCHQAYAQQCPVVPLPNNYSKQNGQFTINDNTSIYIEDQSLSALAYFLQKELLRTTGITLSIQSQKKPAAIVLSRLKGKASVDGEYKLDMSPDEIRISSKTEEGIFYGLSSLMQFARNSASKKGSVTFDCWNIQDAPRYSWRGVLLDESRHFFGKETVKNILDWMAYYKLNRFHWHLTDAPGWRFEIKQYPKLTLVGGIGDYTDSLKPAQYYTQEDIKEIVAYASERFITVIPEVDMPGHATAANKAYPEFSGGGSAKYPEFTFNPGKEETYQYLTNILKETNALFPSNMIHLGGDEVHFGNENWNRDQHVQKLMKDKNLPDLKSVEQYFIQRMADTLSKINNKVLLWDEAVGSSLSPKNTVIFWWRHDRPEQLKLAFDKGYSAVLTPRVPLYFDFVQDSSHHIGRKWKLGEFGSLEKVYNFSLDTLPKPKNPDLILGVQGALWTEHISADRKLEYMLFPRIGALAETAWTQEKNRNYSEFKKRMENHLNLYRKAKLYFYNPDKPSENPEPIVINK